jgi:hypothetical protein
MAMEHIQGETLNARIGGCPLEVGALVDIGLQVADALDEAHLTSWCGVSGSAIAVRVQWPPGKVYAHSRAGHSAWLWRLSL